MILLIGSNGKIGNELLNYLLKNKKKVIAISRHRTKMSEKNNLLKFVQCDINNLEKFSKILKNLFINFNITEIVYNAATTFDSKKLCNLSKAQMNKMTNINFFGLAFLLRILEDAQLKSKTKYRLVYISSNSIVTKNASNPFYTATKAASEYLIKNFAIRNGKKICCNILRPGLIESDMTNFRSKLFFDKIKNLTPLKRLIKNEEVVKVIIELLFETPFALQGQVITLDGGRTI